MNANLETSAAAEYPLSRGRGAPQRRYVNELLRLKCGPMLLALQVFPNVKELTESFGAYHAVLNHLVPHGWDLNDRGTVAIFPGDGGTPRTAATFALRTQWQCYSIDPRLRQRPIYAMVDRLELYQRRADKARFNARQVVVVAVHSHARLEESLRGIVADRVAIVAMPCCVHLTMPSPPDVEYRDPAVLSPQNLIRVWRDVPRV